MKNINDFAQNSIGYRTSRYASEVEYACPYPEAIKINEHIMHEIIDEFFKDYSPSSLGLSREEYINSFHSVSSEYGLDTSLDSNTYFKIDRSRSVEQVLENIGTSRSEISDLMMNIIGSVEPALTFKITRNLFNYLYLACNHNKSVEFLANRYPDLQSFTDSLMPLIEILKLPRLVTIQEASILVQIFKLQDRPFVDKDLMVSELLVSNTNIIEILKDFHQNLYEYSIGKVTKESQWSKLLLNRPLNEVFAYSQDGKICANPKLLKVFANNYIPSLATFYNYTDNLVLDKDKLMLAVNQMKGYGLFHAMILNFRQEENMVWINGVIPSVCPAQTFLPNALKAYIDYIF